MPAPERLFVVTFRDLPVAASSDFAAAQDAALTARTRAATTSRYENRWERVSTTEWRLMTWRAGTGPKHAWTRYSIHTVPAVPAPLAEPNPT